MTFKEFLKKKGISDEDFAKKSAEETAQLQSEFNGEVHKELSEKLEKASTKEELEVVKAEIAKLAKSDEVEKISKDVLEALEEIAKLKEKGQSNDKPESLFDSIKSALLNNKETISLMKTDSGKKASITVKAVAAMTFGTHTTGNVGRTEREAGFQSAPRRTPILLDIVNTSGTNAKHYEWIEKTGHEGGVAMVAEGTVKPQGDWNLELKTQSPKKEAIIVTISKEMLDDIDGMARDIEDEIYEQLRLFMDGQVMDGDGTGNNIIGLDANATPFVASSFAGTIETPNSADAIRVAINQVELNNFFPTHVLMHPSDATAMELEKNPTTGQYILPPFTSLDGTVIKGLPVKTSTVVTQGEAYVGDFNKFKAKIREDITFEMGYRGASGDWEKNMVSFLGEARFFGFIPAVHYGAIVKIDLDVAKGLLEKV